MSSNNKKVLTLLVATAILKCFLALCFYASTDLTNFFRSGLFTMWGKDYRWVYYPGYYFPLQFTQWSALLTSLPWTACWKFLNVFAEAIMGWMVFRALIAREFNIKRALWITMFFVLNPVSMMITVFWGGFDSLVILMCALAMGAYYYGGKGAFLAGLFLAMGVGLKTYPIIALPVFLIDRHTSLRHKLWFASGFAAMLLLILAPLFGPEFFHIARGPIGYQAFPIMGFHYQMTKILQALTSWSMEEIAAFLNAATKPMVAIGVGISYLLSFARRARAMEAVTGAFLFAMVFSLNIAPQYYVWPVFLLMCLVWNHRKERLWAAVPAGYATFIGVFLVYYCLRPGEDSGVFAPAHFVSALEPELAGELHREVFAGWFRKWGVQMALWVLAAAWVAMVLRSSRDPETANPSTPRWAIPAFGAGALMLSAGVALGHWNVRSDALQVHPAHRTNWAFYYGRNHAHMTSVRGEGTWVLDYPGLGFYSVYVDGKALQWKIHPEWAKVETIAEGTSYQKMHGGNPTPPNRKVEIALEGPGPHQIVVIDNVASIHPKFHVPLKPTLTLGASDKAYFRSEPTSYGAIRAFVKGTKKNPFDDSGKPASGLSPLSVAHLLYGAFVVWGLIAIGYALKPAMVSILRVLNFFGGKVRLE